MIKENLAQLYKKLQDEDEIFQSLCRDLDPAYFKSGLNLCRYLLLRSHDLRKVHDELSEHGISSLRSPEAYVFRNIADALRLVHLLEGDRWEPDPNIPSIGYKEGKSILKKHARNLFGKKKRGRPHIMVTMPTEAADDFDLVKRLIESGMTIARINMGHDNKKIWQKMVNNIRSAAELCDTSCQIYVDLAGPKIRTGPIAPNEDRSKQKKKKKKKPHILLKTGDELELHKSMFEGHGPKEGKRGKIVKHGAISVTLPLVINDAAINDRIYFDDGKIAARVIAKEDTKLTLKITRSGAEGSKLRAEKGINLPDTRLKTPSLTKDDIENLDFVASHADIVGYSFVRKPRDIKLLRKELSKRSANQIGIVLKIENNEAVRNLPLLLLEAMKKPPVGVMIARGDLAVELGFEKVSEVQEQILWFCEASHIPVIWATQILENMAKTGLATRAEISDAAMSARADCVMLNKGPYIADATKMLSRIIQAMDKHQFKKKNQLRSLDMARRSYQKIIKKAQS